MPLWCILLFLLLLRSSSSAFAKDAPPASPETRKETVTWGPASLEFSFTPATVSLDQDLMLNLTVIAPEGMTLTIPPLDDRLAGFAVNGHYEDEPASRDGTTTRRLHYRLTPQVADEYRLAPFAVSYTDARQQPPLTGWFPTAPVVLEARSLLNGSPGTALAGNPKPLYIRPPFRTVAGYVAMALAGIGILYALWRLTRRVSHAVALRRLSPRERALRELQDLLAKGLVARGLVKDFYVELTMIVRRYIERRHGVRAPEQTTEEFLAAVSRDSRFTPDVLARLRAFLQAADRVKFAAFQPGGETIHDATTTAEAYLASEPEPEARP